MSRDTSLRQRPRRRYSFSQHGNSEQGQRHGNYLIQNNQADLWSPAYGAGVTTIRIFPAPSPDLPTEWDPYRFPAADPHEPLGFGDWIRRYPAVRSMGDPSVTFITNDPGNPQIEDPQMTPGWLLYRAIDRAVASGQDRPGWASLLRGGRGRGAQLSRPSEVYLVQCAIMSYKNRAYSPPKGFGQDDKLCIMELGPSAGLAMINELHREIEGYQGDPDDFSGRYFNGDPIDLDAGRFINFFTLKDGDPRQTAQAQNSGWNQGSNNPASGGGRGGNDSEPIGYGCFMEEQFQGIPARLREYETVVRARVQPWEELVRVPTIEEQAHLLADKFPPEVIEYAWAAHPEWIPEEVSRRARAAVSVGAPGGMPQAGPAGSPPLAGSTQPVAGGAEAPAQQAPPAQAGAWGQSGAAPAAPAPVAPHQEQMAPPQAAPPQAAPPQMAPPTQQPPAHQPMMPQGNPPVAGQAPPATMGWGTQPNAVAPPAQQPPAQAPSDPALAPGSIPPAAAAIPQGMTQPAAQPVAPVGTQPEPAISPPENNPVAQQFDTPPAQAAPLNPAQEALQRAQQARDAKRG